MSRAHKRKAKGTPLTALAASDPFVQSIQRLAAELQRQGDGNRPTHVLIWLAPPKRREPPPCNGAFAVQIKSADGDPRLQNWKASPADAARSSRRV